MLIRIVITIIGIAIAFLLPLGIIVLLPPKSNSKGNKSASSKDVLSEIYVANKGLHKYSVYFLGWVVDYDPKSKVDFYTHHDKFTWVSPTWYIFDENLRLVEKTYDKDFISKCRSWGRNFRL